MLSVALTCWNGSRGYWSSISRNRPKTGLCPVLRSGMALRQCVKMSSPCCHWSWEQSALKMWLISSPPLCLTRSPLEPSSPAKPPCSLCHQDTGRLPPGQVLFLYMPLALDLVRILLDVFVKLCRTWLILDSGIPKCILSIRPLFILSSVPRLFTSSVYIFLTNKSPRKLSKWTLGFWILLSFLPVKAIFNQCQDSQVHLSHFPF